VLELLFDIVTCIGEHVVDSLDDVFGRDAVPVREPVERFNGQYVAPQRAQVITICLVCRMQKNAGERTRLLQLYRGRVCNPVSGRRGASNFYGETCAKAPVHLGIGEED
jgi:hypothetical protein